MAAVSYQKIRWTIILLAVILTMLFTIVEGKTIYVAVDAAGANDGSSWANAYMFLQDALDDANDSPKPVEIRVAQGTYTPDCGRGYVRGDKEAKFFLKSGVTLKGGFAGAGADDPNAWDHQAYKTVLSGDLSGNDERLLENFVENSDHVIWCIEEDASAVLDGFTITGGYATDRIGGGLLNYQANPTIKRCLFFDNYASQGGGMANRFSSPTVSECTFTGNLVRYGGGGMYNTDQSHPTIEKCIFHDNWSTILGGGGMSCGDSNPTVTHCLFIDNGAPFGGGVYNAASSPFIRNCTFSNNRSNSWGGGMQNEAGSEPTVINCIFWGNIPDGITTFGTAVNVTYSNVQGGHIGVGNMDTDPFFANPDAGDYHLKSQAGRWDVINEIWIIDDVTSPCIDAGDPHSPFDLEPNPNGGVVNAGAYGDTVEASKSLLSISEEDFESNDFRTFPWEHHGDASWTVTSYEKNSGAYSAQAGTIDHDESTTLQVRLDCISGEITFYRKVSSEQDYDFLEFYTDGVKKGEWSGTMDWDQVSFPVTTGTRTFEWTYSKDSSVSEDDDTAWIDDIVFPIADWPELSADADVLIPSPNAAMPVIDGVIDAVWSFSTEQSITHTVMGSRPSGPADCSGTWRALWNWEYIYVLVVVRDEELRADSGILRSWNDDSVEFYIDGNNSKGISVDNDDHQYTFRWNTRVETPRAYHHGEPSLVGVEYAVKTTDDGYLFEIRIPWKSIMGQSPTEGQHIGIDVWINDDDDGGERDSQISWFGTNRNGWNNPSLWATGILVRGNAPIVGNPFSIDGIIVYLMDGM
jgi:hypothetical protein